MIQRAVLVTWVALKAMHIMITVMTLILQQLMI